MKKEEANEEEQCKYSFCSGACLVVFSFEIVYGEMQVHTTDGRTIAVPVDRQNIRSIEFTDNARVSIPQETLNLAKGKSAQQSSISFGGDAQRAIDGNTDGNYFNNSVSNTNTQPQAWWQVDLGTVGRIKNIRIWNRTDCCAERLSNFYVLISENPFFSNDLNATLRQPGVSNYYFGGVAGKVTDVLVNKSGRYVRVQLADANYLQLAEVEVMGY